MNYITRRYVYPSLRTFAHGSLVDRPTLLGRFGQISCAKYRVSYNRKSLNQNSRDPRISKSPVCDLPTIVYIISVRNEVQLVSYSVSPRWRGRVLLIHKLLVYGIWSNIGLVFDIPMSKPGRLARVAAWKV